MKKRKCIIAAIVLGLLISYTVSFADIDSKLKGHWAENIIDKDFVNTHFSYLNSNDGALFDPNAYITKDDFLSSLNSVMTKHNKEALAVETEGSTSNSLLTRKEAVILIVKAIEITRDVQLSEADDIVFNDLEKLNDEEKLCILKANKLKIVNGYKDNTFRPEDNVLQIQAILFLQRLKGELDMKTIAIPFKAIDSKSSHNVKEESVNVVEQEGKVKVTVTKQFNTSGYSMYVDRIEKISDGTFKIYLNIKRPDPKVIVLQVISYKSVTVEIDKAELGEGAYKFEAVDRGMGDIKLKSVK
ncbi:S-layer homology domain-containing protein [Brassicibacter mesophilus]|uniref:S-layer homology domain-containing protein n=1 Tax=Brassicibacter mesophilus TaxID=745119 RepID=UPI003D1CF61B